MDGRSSQLVDGRMAGMRQLSRSSQLAAHVSGEVVGSSGGVVVGVREWGVGSENLTKKI